jgi:predicted Zn-dependent protease with MMP-like domain
MRADDFDEMLERIYRRVPARFRRRLQNIAVIVEDEPSMRQLAAARVPPGGTLLGLYEGRPLTHRSFFDSFTMPDRITIFQRPHERMARDRVQLERLVEQTLWHEIAHYLGMDERQVRAAERTRRTRRLYPH